MIERLNRESACAGRPNHHAYQRPKPQTKYRETTDRGSKFKSKCDAKEPHCTLAQSKNSKYPQIPMRNRQIEEIIITYTNNCLTKRIGHHQPTLFAAASLPLSVPASGACCPPDARPSSSWDCRAAPQARKGPPQTHLRPAAPALSLLGDCPR